jgi:hypothetical protein
MTDNESLDAKTSMSSAYVFSNSTSSAGLTGVTGYLQTETKEEITPQEIDLVAKDGTKFKIMNTYTFCSQLLKTAIIHDPKETGIVVRFGNSTTLKHIINYMLHHKGAQPSMIDKERKGFGEISVVCKDEWEVEWINKISETEGNQALYDLMSMANYLDMKELVYLSGARIACVCKGIPVEKLKEVLDPKNKHKSTPATSSSSSSSSSSFSSSNNEEKMND